VQRLTKKGDHSGKHRVNSGVYVIWLSTVMGSE
jgi:hypothetical protein